MSELTHEDVQRILAIIDSIGDRTVAFEYGDIKLQMTRSGESEAAAPALAAQAVRPAPGAAPATAAPLTTASTHAAPAATESGGPQSPSSRIGVDAAPAAAGTEIPEGLVAVTAPTSGTFYRAASPAAPPFVEVGDRVEANDTVGVFDVMKLFMSLRAGVNGTVAAILVENQSVCEQGQPLVLIKAD